VKILQRSSADLRQRMLELFPVASLRANFSLKGSKAWISSQLASSSVPADISKIAKFVDENMHFCKQHVHVLSHSGDAELPDNLPGGERIARSKDHALYVVKTTYNVVKLDPPENAHIDFFWPIRIDLLDEYALVRFVVLEKNVALYFDRGVFARGKSSSEEGIITSLLANGTLGNADLDKGIKALWAADKIDALRVKYMMRDSTDTKNMHEAKGLKQTDPKAYREVQKHPLYMCAFMALDGLSGVKHFSADPTNGLIGFTKYSNEGSSGDELIQQVLENN
jgi:hypothetical protein